MFKKGAYKTTDGHEAIVAQVKPLGQNNWVLRGSVAHEGVLYMHVWSITGHSNTGHPCMNLVENNDSKR